MSLYNVVFTALTPLVVGTMDSDVNREMSRKYPGLPLPPPKLHVQCLHCHHVINNNVAIVINMNTNIIVWPMHCTSYFLCV